MISIPIRTLEKSDLEALFDVAQRAWRYTYRGILPPDFIERWIDANYSAEIILPLFPAIQAGEMAFFVATDTNNIVGFANMGDRGRGIELIRIYLLPEYMRKGIGSALLEECEKFAIGRGSSSYFCYVVARNKIGVHFYQKHKFRHVPLKDEYGQWYMEKSLSF
jgi:GNAT superfamily N-acetyltransferase